MSRLAAFQKPLALAVAENATSPAASALGVEIWSTTANKRLRWNGTTWAAASAGSGGGSSVAFADFANQRVPTVVNGVPSGVAQGQAIQAADFDVRSATWAAVPSSVTPLNYGFTTTTFGSAGALAVSFDTFEDDTTFRQQQEMRRMSFGTTTTAGTTAGWKASDAVYLSNANAYGGFFFSARFSFTLQTSTQYWFVGLWSSASTLTGNPSTAQDILGFAQTTPSANMQLVCNGTTSFTTTVSPTVDRNNSNLMSVYDVFLCNPRGTRTIYWGCRVAGKDNMPALVRSYTYTVGDTNVPIPLGGSVGGQALYPQVWTSNGVTANAVQLQLSRVYLETDT